MAIIVIGVVTENRMPAGRVCDYACSLEDYWIEIQIGSSFPG
jgi:hypothetical protein